MFQRIVVRMTNELTTLAPPTVKIKVVAPSRKKALGVHWRIHLVSPQHLPAGVDLEGRV